MLLSSCYIPAGLFTRYIFARLPWQRGIYIYIYIYIPPVQPGFFQVGPMQVSCMKQIHAWFSRHGNACQFHAHYMHVSCMNSCTFHAKPMHETCISMCRSCTFHARNMHSHHAHSMHVVCMVPYICCIQ